MGVIGSIALAISVALTELWGLAGIAVALLTWMVARRSGSEAPRDPRLNRVALLSAATFGMLLVMSAIPSVDTRWLIFFALLCGVPWAFWAVASRYQPSDD